MLAHFFKLSFREIYFSEKFWERQFFSIVKTSNKRTHIRLLINQFLSFIELKDVAIDKLLN